ncbi:MAG: hypothetical protein AT715_06715 [Thermoproteus sp. JCHS_4]|nr:MAG: hypothetical protein AT715_06715 [Thermoproteus sp. JCHS_4]
MEILEYFVGFLLGDGYLYHYKKEGKYLVRVADSNKEFLEMLRTEMLSAGYKGHIYKIKGRNAYVLEFSNKKLYYLCLELAANLLKNPTAPFVAGLIDAEGSLQKPRRGSLRLCYQHKLHVVTCGVQLSAPDRHRGDAEAVWKDPERGKTEIPHNSLREGKNYKDYFGHPPETYKILSPTTGPKVRQRARPPPLVAFPLFGAGGTLGGLPA